MNSATSILTSHCSPATKQKNIKDLYQTATRSSPAELGVRPFPPSERTKPCLQGIPSLADLSSNPAQREANLPPNLQPPLTHSSTGCERLLHMNGTLARALHAFPARFCLRLPFVWPKVFGSCEGDGGTLGAVKELDFL
ncbi:uncharacterized protein LOC114579047 [Dendrobium catenatum]|uniref:uncharacterized protein LOC114579047 n=1 Tax=Dendrobium catenatum TaxID=906689 RepID=UPI0010A0915F|nr:uncharacterized protein LOC114579047 [Dendrobium catenatum]